MFVSVWIDQHFNFGNNTTNRVESQHAKLKIYMDKNAKCSLDRLLGCIDEIVKSQLILIKESLEHSRVVRIHQHNLRCFKLLRGFVSNESLKIVLEDRKRWKDHKGDCGCRLRTAYGLPCACELSMHISSRKYSQLLEIYCFKLFIIPNFK